MEGEVNIGLVQKPERGGLLARALLVSSEPSLGLLAGYFYSITGIRFFAPRVITRIWKIDFRYAVE